jgi:hypothetical protein
MTSVRTRRAFHALGRRSSSKTCWKPAALGSSVFCPEASLTKTRKTTSTKRACRPGHCACPAPRPRGGAWSFLINKDTSLGSRIYIMQEIVAYDGEWNPSDSVRFLGLFKSDFWAARSMTPPTRRSRRCILGRRIRHAIPSSDFRSRPTDVLRVR